jgi:hypothetical protein
MRKLIASVVALLPLLAAAQEAAQPPPPQAEPQAPQYPPQYAPPPQYTPPPPQGQYQPQPAQPQPQPYRKPGHQRDSWYIGFGIGGGDASISLPASASPTPGTYSMKEFFGTSPTKLTMNFKVGATLTPRLLLGADITGFAASATYDTIYGEADRSLSISTLTGMVTFFPMETGLFLRGGLGLASFSTKLSVPGSPTSTADASGVAYAAGVGYAFWLGRSFNLTANLDFSGQSYGGGDGPDSTRFWALGLGFDWY